MATSNSQLGSIAKIFTIIGAIFAAGYGIYALVYPTPVPPFAIGPSQNVLTTEILDELLESRIEKRLTQLEAAHGDEKARLKDQIGELQRQRREPEKALQEALALNSSLQEQLSRESNELGADKLEAASEALAAGDYSVADDLFAEIEARNATAVGSAARAALARGEIAEAEVRWADAAAHYARAAGLEPSLQALRKAGDFAERSGNYPAALRFGERALEQARAGDDQIALARVLNDYALTLNSAGRYDEAEPLYREAMAIVEKTLGKEHPSYAASLNNLAGLHKATGRYDEAEPLFRDAMAITGATLGKEHPSYAGSLNNLALLLDTTGRSDEAEPLFREAMAITGATLGKEHPTYATNLNNLAVLYASTQRFDKALPLMEQALAIRQAALGKEHPDTDRSRRSLAAMRADAGQ